VRRDHKVELLRLLGAALLLTGGAVHLQLSFDDYGTADIDRSFAVNALASALVAAYLALRRDPIGPLAGIVVSAGTLAAFALSRTGDGLLDFRATGVEPSPQAAVTLTVEIAAIVVLALALLLARRHPAPSHLPPPLGR
jgi:hypothetical protein